MVLKITIMRSMKRDFNQTTSNCDPEFLNDLSFLSTSDVFMSIQHGSENNHHEIDEKALSSNYQ